MSTEAEDRDEDRTLTLHFEGMLTLDHTLPAAALVKSLQEFQRIVHLMAMQVEGRQVRRRARRTKEIERLYPVICKIPEDGGFALPVEIGRIGDKLFDAQAVGAAMLGVRQAIEAVEAGDEATLISVLPDRQYRLGVLKAFRAMQPPAQELAPENWTVR